MSDKEKATELEEELQEETVEVTEAETEIEETPEKTREEELEEQLAAAKDAHLRTAAEYANYRARSAKEKEQTFTNAKCTVVADILPAIDNLERAIANDSGDYEGLKKGVEMTLTGLMTALEKLGVEQYGEAGDSFDPNVHNAVMHVEDEKFGDNEITDVFQKGYKIGDRVIRPAMVKTAN